MTYRIVTLLPLFALLALFAACDSGPGLPVEPPYDATSAWGTFVGTVNGVPWTAPALYTVDRERGFTALQARTNSGPPSYYTWVLYVTYDAPSGLVEGIDYPSGFRIPGLLMETYGDAVADAWEPVDPGPGAFRVTAVDSAAGRLRAEFAAAMFTTRNPDGDRDRTGSQLQDTVRVAGVFEIDLTDTFEGPYADSLGTY